MPENPMLAYKGFLILAKNKKNNKKTIHANFEYNGSYAQTNPSKILPKMKTQMPIKL